MQLWITQDTVLGTLDQRPSQDARWMMQHQSTHDDAPQTVQLWSDDLDQLTGFQRLWQRQGHDAVITDMDTI